MEFPRPEQLSKRERTNAERVSSIIHAITDRHYIPRNTVEPILEPRNSQSFQYDIPDTQEGFDKNGNFHRPVLERTEVAQQELGGRWDDMGRYDVV